MTKSLLSAQLDAARLPVVTGGGSPGEPADLPQPARRHTSMPTIIRRAGAGGDGVASSLPSSSPIASRRPRSNSHSTSPQSSPATPPDNFRSRYYKALNLTKGSNPMEIPAGSPRSATSAGVRRDYAASAPLDIPLAMRGGRGHGLAAEPDAPASLATTFVRDPTTWGTQSPTSARRALRGGSAEAWSPHSLGMFQPGTSSASAFPPDPYPGNAAAAAAAGGVGSLPGMGDRGRHGSVSVGGGGGDGLGKSFVPPHMLLDSKSGVLDIDVRPTRRDQGGI